MRRNKTSDKTDHVLNIERKRCLKFDVGRHQFKNSNYIYSVVVCTSVFWSTTKDVIASLAVLYALIQIKMINSSPKNVSFEPSSRLVLSKGTHYTCWVFLFFYFLFTWKKEKKQQRLTFWLCNDTPFSTLHTSQAFKKQVYTAVRGTEKGYESKLGKKQSVFFFRSLSLLLFCHFDLLFYCIKPTKIL